MDDTQAIFDHHAALQHIPSAPGVYLMVDRKDRIVYVGKAKDLKARVRSYFSGSDPRPFVALLGRLLKAIDVVLTGNEKEALLLESTLIKRHRPRFNFMMRDDKDMLQLRVDPGEAWPKVRVVRKRRQDGASYFGPYPSAGSCREVLHLLNRYFKLRTCREQVFRNRSRPCLQYEIGRCSAPCVGLVERESYLRDVNAAMLFLGGKHATLIARLQEKMEAAAMALAYEQAAHLRDQIAAIRRVRQRQEVVQEAGLDQDVFALHREGERVSVAVMIVRDGRLEGVESHHARDQLTEDADIMVQVALQRYRAGYVLPQEILFDRKLAALAALRSLLEDVAGRRVGLRSPKRGAGARLVQMAVRNAEQQFIQHFTRERDEERVLMGLQKSLALGRLPRRIECFDISNLQAGAMVAAMVVFVDGKPAPRHYRSYKIRDVRGQDDYSALYEVILRRFRRIADGLEGADAPVLGEEGLRQEGEPDLVIIDGGKGQLRAALEALEALALGGRYDVIALAKGRPLGGGSQEEEVTHSPERVFLPGQSEPVVLGQRSDEVFLLQRVRDETHRRAIGHHRLVRGKEGMGSRLDSVEGVGAKRKAALLRAFGSVRGILGATDEGVAAAAGISLALAQRVRDALGGSGDEGAGEDADEVT